MRPVEPFAMVPVSMLRADLSPLAFRIWIALTRFAGHEARCWPSNETLLEMLPRGTHLRNLRRAKRELENVGLLRSTRRYAADGRERSCFYTLLQLDEGDEVLPTASKDDGGETDLLGWGEGGENAPPGGEGGEIAPLEGGEITPPLEESQKEETIRQELLRSSCPARALGSSTTVEEAVQTTVYGTENGAGVGIAKGKGKARGRAVKVSGSGNGNGNGDGNGAKEVIVHYHDRWREEYGEDLRRQGLPVKMPFGPREAGQLGRVVRVHGPVVARRLVDRWFDHGGKFAAETAHGVGAFAGSLGRLLVQTDEGQMPDGDFEEPVGGTGRFDR